MPGGIPPGTPLKGNAAAIAAYPKHAEVKLGLYIRNNLPVTKVYSLHLHTTPNFITAKVTHNLQCA